MRVTKDFHDYEHEAYISVDVEAAGPIPGKYSMLSLGACLVGSPEISFYVELRPINNHVVPEAIAISGLSLDKLSHSGTDPAVAMESFRNWIDNSVGDSVPIFVGFNAPFDWQFVNWYFHEFTGENPFGINALDIKAYYMGYTGCAWRDTSSSQLPAWLQPKKSKTHNALDDAVVQAEIFAKLLSNLRASI